MLRRATILGVSVVLFAAMVLLFIRPGLETTNTPPPPLPPPAQAKTMTVNSSTPVRWSAKIDEPVRKALQTGRRRLAITVSAYEPPEGAAMLVVRLLTADPNEPREIGRFSVHPNAPFNVSDGVEPHRFLISLADEAGLPEESQVRVEVGFDTSHGEVRGGMAEIAFEIVDITPPASQE